MGGVRTWFLTLGQIKIQRWRAGVYLSPVIQLLPATTMYITNSRNGNPISSYLTSRLAVYFVQAKFGYLGSCRGNLLRSISGEKETKEKNLRTESLSVSEWSIEYASVLNPVKVNNCVAPELCTKCWTSVGLWIGLPKTRTCNWYLCWNSVPTIR